MTASWIEFPQPDNLEVPKFFTSGNNSFRQNGVESPFVLMKYGNNYKDDAVGSTVDEKVGLEVVVVRLVTGIVNGLTLTGVEVLNCFCFCLSIYLLVAYPAAAPTAAAAAKLAPVLSLL
jgi:hypothetical protein